MTEQVTLPAGYRHIALGDIDSTNTEVFRRADVAEPANLWLTAQRQTIGRGRGAKPWTSEPGNLYASLYLRRSIALGTALQLPFVAGVAIHDAIRDEGGGELPTVDLKWPNDILINGAKVCGTLVESRQPQTGDGLVIAMGFGVNVAHHPADTPYPATHLAAWQAEAQPEPLFLALANRLNAWLNVWDDGAGFDAIRKAWLARSIPVGHEISVTDGDGRLAGTFAGLDADGALLLNVAGKIRRILFGDVMIPAATGGAPHKT